MKIGPIVPSTLPTIDHSQHVILHACGIETDKFYLTLRLMQLVGPFDSVEAATAWYSQQLSSLNSSYMDAIFPGYSGSLLRMLPTLTKLINPDARLAQLQQQDKDAMAEHEEASQSEASDK